MMEDACEKSMDEIAGFESSKPFPVTGRQYNVCTSTQMINLLASSNRYGYIFYATETEGLAIIPSKCIDQGLASKKASDDDDDNNQNEDLSANSILHRSYMPNNSINTNSPIVPYWISLNSDESILAVLISQPDANSWFIVFYNVVQLIQQPDSTPLCAPMQFSNDSIGGSIQNFSWNPAITNMFAYIDANGFVFIYEIDQNSKQIKLLGKCNSNPDFSSICWSPKGKQIVIATFDGALALYDQNMNLKKNYPAININSTFPPCISVSWISTYQFFLGFSENSPDENPTDDTYFHVMVTYEKDQLIKSTIYRDLFFDASDAPQDVTPQYFHARINESNIIICGVSKSAKINVYGADELQKNSLDIWTFDDSRRATVKGTNDSSDHRPILTGMALGLNSTLSIPQGGKKLPPCPMLLLSNSDGLLQVYYFIHNSLPSICRTPEVIKDIQVLRNTVKTPIQTSQPLPSNALGAPASSFFAFSAPTTTATPSSNNGFSFSNFGSMLSTSANPTSSQTKDKSTTNTLSSIIQAPAASSVNDLSKTFSMSNFGTTTSVTHQTDPIINHTQSVNSQIVSTKPQSNETQPTPPVINRQQIIQKVQDMERRLKDLQNPLSQPAESSGDLEQSLESLKKVLKDMKTSVQTFIESIKTIGKEHIESLTKIESGRHQIRMSQKENLHSSLYDRELDPWTQSRLDSIQTKYDKLKNDLNVLLLLTNKTLHNKSLSQSASDTSLDDENDDFLPDLELLDSVGTVENEIRKSLVELSRKVAFSEKQLNCICDKLSTTTLSSKSHDSTFSKTKSSSNRPFQSSDADILSYLQKNHANINKVNVPLTPLFNLSSSVEQKKSSIVETPKQPDLSASSQPSTPKQSTSVSTEPEGFQNMLRLVRTSIELFSGVASPEKLRELSDTISRSPLASAQRSTSSIINTSSTQSKTANLSQSSTNTKPSTPKASSTNIAQMSGKSTASPIPNASVLTATPVTQTVLSDLQSKLPTTKSVTQTVTDLSKSPTMAATGDSAIRGILSQNTMPLSATMLKSAGVTPVSTPAQVVSQTSAPSTITTTTMTAPATTALSSTQSTFGLSPLASTLTTSVQSTSPSTKQVTSTNLPLFGGNASFGSLGFSVSSTTPSAIPFGNAAITNNTGAFFTGASSATTSTPNSLATTTTTTTTTTSSSMGIFGTATTTTSAPFGASNTTPATSAPSTGFFATPTTSTASPFGAAATPTTSAPVSNTFGVPAVSSTGPFGKITTPATSTTSTSIFGASPVSTASLFGATATPTTSSSGTGLFGSPPTSTAGPFGSTTAATPTISTSSPFGSGFGTGTTTSAASPSLFGGSTITTTSPFGGSFSSPASTSSGFGAAPTLATNTPFGGFGASSTGSTSTPTASGFGSSGFSFNSAVPVTSTAQSTTGGALFGSNSSTTAKFGQGFTGFGAQTGSSASSTGFTFGGFGGAQPAQATAPSAGFGSFGAPTAPSSGSSPFGTGLFGGGAAGQTSSFGAAPSFGASTAQTTTSPSFTSYRK